MSKTKKIKILKIINNFEVYKKLNKKNEYYKIIKRFMNFGFQEKL
jgi:hypothetical protein